MIFGRSTFLKNVNGYIKINNMSLMFLDECKNLGIRIDCSLKFNELVKALIRNVFCT